MDRDSAVVLAKKLQRLIDHEGTLGEERENAKRRLGDILTRHGLTEADLVAEALEPDLPPDASYEQILDSILTQVGIDSNEFHRYVGKVLAKGLGGLPFIGELLRDKTDHQQLGRAVVGAVGDILKEKR